MRRHSTPILYLVALCFFLGLSACTSSDQPAESETEAEQAVVEEPEKTSIDEPIVIGAFSEFPEGIDGCSCYFSQHASALESGSYIFVTNFESLGFMMLNDKIVEFKLEETTELKNGKLMERWTNPKFTLIKKTTATGQLDETWQHAGTITIKPIKGQEIESTIVGECGC